MQPRLLALSAALVTSLSSGPGHASPGGLQPGSFFDDPLPPAAELQPGTYLDELEAPGACPLFGPELEETWVALAEVEAGGAEACAVDVDSAECADATLQYTVLASTVLAQAESVDEEGPCPTGLGVLGFQVGAVHGVLLDGLQSFRPDLGGFPEGTVVLASLLLGKEGDGDGEGLTIIIDSAACAILYGKYLALKLLITQLQISHAGTTGRTWQTFDLLIHILWTKLELIKTFWNYSPCALISGPLT